MLVRVLDRMEEQDWVERRPDPADRRAHCIYLKPKAEPIVEQISRWPTNVAKMPPRE